MCKNKKTTITEFPSVIIALNPINYIQFHEWFYGYGGNWARLGQ